ncbi:unnamed protein product [Adineta ricciae]|uniref:SKICH domain-containing protein n=1 Tax=Adineta ricciae TaxID=249248 RepID=A0A814CXY5_ADIRI|nr:unnamed protein product [Adineta ricciae]CAF0946486.1 unnamed protein product [Adineta ricciae]
MSEINDQSSDTSSELNWPVDHTMDRMIAPDRVVFENVADQYVKGEDVTAFFTVLPDVKINTNEDQIGLLRVGSTNIKECVAFAPVQFNPSTASGSTFHGTATFPSSSLPVTDDEFYQFCYITNKTKNIASSIPFQLNCALDDVDLLSNAPVSRSKPDGLIALADQDNDDVVIIHTKRMLTEEKLRKENRHLLEMNRHLESQRDECQAKLELLNTKTKEDMEKFQHNMQALATSHKTAIAELSSRQQLESNLRAQFDACQKLCEQYQSDSLRHAERSRTLEDAHAQVSNDANQLRSQLAVTSQLAKDQATQIIGLERQLMQSNELAKGSNQRQLSLEQQLRDLRLTSEKHQLSTKGQLNEYKTLIEQNTNQIETLEKDNNSLREEVDSLRADNGRLTEQSEADKATIKDLAEQLDRQHAENEALKSQREVVQNELDEFQSKQQAMITLTNSFDEIKKRCVKHQKSEIEVKRQLVAHKSFISDLQNEKQELIERLAHGAEEYKTLFRKCAMLEQKLGGISSLEEIVQSPTPVTTPMTEEEEKEQQQQQPVTGAVSDEQEKFVPTLCNTAVNQTEENNQSLSGSVSDVDGEIRVCPMCYWQFPADMVVNAKHEHIESHFQG